jgi:hypothetical protein
MLQSFHSVGFCSFGGEDRSINSTMQYVGTTDAQAAEALQKALMDVF